MKPLNFWGMMAMLIFGSAIFITQCNQPNNNQPIGLLSKTTKPTEFGVWVSGGYYQSPQYRNAVLDSLGVKTTLLELRSTDTTESKYQGLNYFINQGKGIQLNYLYNRRPDSIFTFTATKKERNNYNDSLKEFVKNYRPIWLCVEREPTNDEYYSGNVNDYKKQLKLAITTCHDSSIKVSDGGFTTRDITLLVYRYYQNKGDTNSANSWGERCLPPQFVKALENRTNTELESHMSRLDSFVKAYRRISLDAINFHWYEPVKYRGVPNSGQLSDTVTRATEGALKEVVAYIYQAMGKPSISNEMGQLNSRPELTRSMLQAARDAGLLYCGWFSGDMGTDKAKSLVTPSGILTLSGNEFKNFLK